jgi:hypothetical protein
VDVNLPQRNLEPDHSKRDQEDKRVTAGKKSPVVTRRIALGMAFRQALSSVLGARDKATEAISAAGAKLTASGKTPPPPEP